MSSTQYEVYFFKKVKLENEEEPEPELAIEIGYFDKAITSPLINYINTNITPISNIDDINLDKEELKKMLDHFKTIEADNSIKAFLEYTLNTLKFNEYNLILRAW